MNVLNPTGSQIWARAYTVFDNGIYLVHSNPEFSEFIKECKRNKQSHLVTCEIVCKDIFRDLRLARSLVWQSLYWVNERLGGRWLDALPDE